jgi:hypothetical protein
VTVTAASNANPTVLTAAGHGFADNDELLFDSLWEDATDTVWKADQLTTDTLSLKSLDTSDTQWFPAGTGTGTLRKVTNWVEIGQVLDVNPEGGGAKFMNIEPLSKRNGIKQPIGFDPSGLKFTLGYDPSKTDQVQLDAISRNLSQKVAFKFLLTGGQVGYGYGYAQLSRIPNMRKGAPISVELSLNFLGQFVGYAS